MGRWRLQHLRERRYRVDEQILEEVRRHAEAAWAPELGTLRLHAPRAIAGFRRVLPPRVWPLPGMGISLKLGRPLERGLASAERSGSPGGRGQSWSSWLITAFRAGDVETVRELLPEAAGRGSDEG